MPNIVTPAKTEASGQDVAVIDETTGGLSWLWVLAWIVLAAAGIYYQLRSVNEIRLCQNGLLVRVGCFAQVVLLFGDSAEEIPGVGIGWIGLRELL